MSKKKTLWETLKTWTLRWKSTSSISRTQEGSVLAREMLGHLHVMGTMTNQGNVESPSHSLYHSSASSAAFQSFQLCFQHATEVTMLGTGHWFQERPQHSGHYQLQETLLASSSVSFKTKTKKPESTLNAASQTSAGEPCQWQTPWTPRQGRLTRTAVLHLAGMDLIS